MYPNITQNPACMCESIPKHEFKHHGLQQQPDQKFIHKSFHFIFPPSWPSAGDPQNARSHCYFLQQSIPCPGGIMGRGVVCIRGYGRETEEALEQEYLHGGNGCHYCLLLRDSTNHSIASSSPVPLVADVLKICHFLSLSAGSPRELATSVGVMACSISCLLANTTRMAFFSSSSSNMATSSDFEIPILSLSLLSTT
uniref:Uncharacterized protein n=1 Tax=Anguilla anguilla TaxID=7936 RepID=A0A0E9X3R7_ANGAN